jgi:hypothetical protein
VTVPPDGNVTAVGAVVNNSTVLSTDKGAFKVIVTLAPAESMTAMVALPAARFWTVIEFPLTLTFTTLVSLLVAV